MGSCFDIEDGVRCILLETNSRVASEHGTDASLVDWTASMLAKWRIVVRITQIDICGFESTLGRWSRITPIIAMNGRSSLSSNSLCEAKSDKSRFITNRTDVLSVYVNAVRETSNSIILPSFRQRFAATSSKKKSFTPTILCICSGLNSGVKWNESGYRKIRFR